MKDISPAIKVAVAIREYLKENSGCAQPSGKELNANYERISVQLKRISNL